MKFEYQVKPFSAGQPPDQIEKVLNQSAKIGANRHLISVESGR